MTDHHASSAGQPGDAPSGNVHRMTTAPREISGAVANRLGAAFYTAVAAVALAGQSLAAVHWLGWPLLGAIVAVAVIELGGIALAARADFRRRKGERALAARTLSAAVAAGAVAINWLGHDDHLAGGFFAGMSALGYAVWLINSGDRRRDQLRAANMLPPTPPAYEMWSHWVRHPFVTARARTLAKATPALGLYGSLSAAADQIKAERRERAVARILRRKLATATDGVAADLAAATYDLTEIARRLAERADYDWLTDLIAAEMAPDLLVGRHRVDTEADTAPDTDVANTADKVAARMAADLAAVTATDTANSVAIEGPAVSGQTPVTDTAKLPVNGAATNVDKTPDIGRSNGRTSKPSDTATKVANLAAKYPDMDVATMARRVKASERTVRRHLAAIRPATERPAPTQSFSAIPDGDDDQERAPVKVNGHELEFAGVA